MEKVNLKILKENLNKRLNLEELIVLGFKDDCILNLYDTTEIYYSGVTLSWNNIDYYISSNTFTKPQAELRNYICELELKIKKMKSQVSFLRFEMSDNAKASEVENEMNEYSKILDALKKI